MKKSSENKTQEQEFADILGEAERRGEITPGDEIAAHAAVKEGEKIEGEAIEEKPKDANLK